MHRTEWKALGGIAAVMVGSAYMARYQETTAIAALCGLLAVAGGIVIIEQLPDAEPA